LLPVTVKKYWEYSQSMPAQMTYDITKSFEENVAYGPIWHGQFPVVPTPKETTTFFGKPVHSAFGVSACPLTHGSRGVKFCSQLGYDIITYRSVRSTEWHGQKPPHWRYVDISGQLTTADLLTPVVASENPFKNQDVSSANSFGIQSLKPEYWQADFEIAKASLSPGQLLILSLMFTPEAGKDVVTDSQAVAHYAQKTSADVFEINLAHPNSGMKSLVYEDIALSAEICRAVKKVLGDRPLLAKVGYYKDAGLLTEFLRQTAGVIDGISSANTFALPVVSKTGEEVFPGRPKAGVSGAGIRTLYMEQAQAIMAAKKTLGLTHLVVVGIGGVTQPKHIQQYLEIGVDAVQSASGVWANPELAINYKKTLTK
jgi:dihydroorotate dehydrogenase (NAD+) catalytic subunit